MPKTLNPKWKDRMLDEIKAGRVDETLADALPAKWLILRLTEKNIPFRVYSLGAGIRRITTDTDSCPCCKKPL